MEVRKLISPLLLNVDTHEIYGVSRDSAEHQQGRDESEFVRAWFATATTEYDGDWALVVQTFKDTQEKYGRYLALIERKSDQEDLANSLIETFPDVESGSGT